jgi:hypothetical protein
VLRTFLQAELERHDSHAGFTSIIVGSDLLLHSRTPACQRIHIAHLIGASMSEITASHQSLLAFAIRAIDR